MLWRLLAESATCLYEPPGPIADLILSSLFTKRKFSDAILKTVAFLSGRLLTTFLSVLFPVRPRIDIES